MSEDIKVETTVSENETTAPDSPNMESSEMDALKAQIAGLKNDLSAVINNKNEILNEKKVQQQQLRDAEEEKMRKKGDFEKLLQSSEASRKELESKLNKQMESISASRVKGLALEAAQKVSDGGKIKFLAREIQDRLKDVEGEVRVLDKSGNPTISSIDDLLNEMKSSGDYDDLLTGTKSSGGGASGSVRSADITTNPFKKGDTFNLTQQAQLLKDDPAKAAQLKALATNS